MKINLKETEQCSFCNFTRETVIHLLWECTYTQNLWTCLINSMKD